MSFMPPVPRLPGPLPRILLGLVPVLGAFKSQGRGGEVEDKERKGSRDRPERFPPVGSVVYRNMKLVEHSGVYIGDGLFAYKNKEGEVVAEELIGFLGSSASNLFVSVGRTGKPLGLPSIANRAKEAVGTRSNHGTYSSCDNGRYDLVLNNCHIFTSYCITGERNGDTGVGDLKKTAKRQAYMPKWIKWRFDA